MLQKTLLSGEISSGWTLEEISNFFDAELIGPKKQEICRAVPAGVAASDGITFADSKKNYQAAVNVPIGAIIVSSSIEISSDIPHLIVENPKKVFFEILQMSAKELALEPGIHPTAIVHPDAVIAESARVGAYCVIEEDVLVREKAVIHPHCYIGDRSSVGPKAVIYPHVTVYHDVKIGARSVIHSGTVIGVHGFGYEKLNDQLEKAPQAGGVIIKEDVEIGANCTIDRATCGNTIIDSGTKFGNLILFAHNSTVGRNSRLCGHNAIGGSTDIGAEALIGGTTSVSDHIKIAAEVSLTGDTRVISNLEEKGIYGGKPSLPYSQYMRNITIQKKLPQLLQRIKKLEKQLEQLQEGQK